MIRKHIAVLATVVALFAANEATAQAPAGRDTVQRQAQRVRGDRRKGERARKMRRAGGKALFRGVDLSQAQRDQMKGIKEKYRAQFKTLRATIKPEVEAARAARQRGDTVAARAAWERTSTTRERMKSLMEQQRAEVRALLTPEQQQVFDRNAQDAGRRRGR